jgi:hypothetical protein
VRPVGIGDGKGGRIDDEGMKMGYINIEERGVSGLGWDYGLQSISRHGNGASASHMGTGKHIKNIGNCQTN